MKQYVRRLDDFREYKMIKESFEAGEVINIPGFHLVTLELIGDSLNFVMSNGNIMDLPIADLNDIASDMNNLSPTFLDSLKSLFDTALLARHDNTVGKKLNVLKGSETMELFDIEDGNFFSGIRKSLLGLGAKEFDISTIEKNLPIFYDRNEVDGLSPDGLAIFVEYLNCALEYVGAKIYGYLMYLRKEDCIDNVNTQGPNDSDGMYIADIGIDDETGSEVASELDEGAFVRYLYEGVGDEFTSMEATTYRANADYHTCIKDITKIVKRAAVLAGVTLEDACDRATGRKVNSTTIYMEFAVKGTAKKVCSILSPVESQKVSAGKDFGGSDYIFFVDDAMKPASAGVYLFNENEISVVLTN